MAEKFGKEHKNVLSSIRESIKGCAENAANLMFEETTYITDQNGQEYPIFIMNRDGFTLLAMGFTGKKAHIQVGLYCCIQCDGEGTERTEKTIVTT